ncbi:TPA: hypothetical protein HA265_05895 [Candidatus Woesearchaeota archaeon]|nr:hypothetical protein [Candidatus Woesearchaeota archaeon]
MAEDYFVQIKEPAEVRRKLLANSKQLIQILQRYERIKELRVRKIEKISQLRKLNQEINLLMAKLKKEMPKAEVRIKQEPRRPDRQESRLQGNELEKLEAELKRIEDKIGMMS